MSWLDLVKQHHIGIKDAFLDAIANPDKDTIGHAKWLLNAHCSAEEAVIYQALSANSIDDELLEKQQTGAKEEIHVLSHDEDDPDISEKLQGLLDAILEHVKLEEKSKFPKLYGKLTAEENISLGKSYLDHYNKWVDVA